MTTRVSEVALGGCLGCSIDHHHACSRVVKDDAGGWTAIYCCCGLAVDLATAAAEEAEYAAYAQELRRRGWSQPADPAQQVGGSGPGDRGQEDAAP
jgi:hypothetical protein